MCADLASTPNKDSLRKIMRVNTCCNFFVIKVSGVSI